MQAGGSLAAGGAQCGGSEGKPNRRAGSREALEDDPDALRLAFISLIGWHLPCRRRLYVALVLDCDWLWVPLQRRLQLRHRLRLRLQLRLDVGSRRRPY